MEGSRVNPAKALSFYETKKLKACEGSGSLMDCISGLPDDIIVYILSMLKMKEAGRTSVLSKRWRYVWAHISVLDFDASDVMAEICWRFKKVEVERPRYLRWVNQVVRSYKGPIIDEFTVRFDIDNTSTKDIDSWVKFITEKQVKKLNFNFSHFQSDEDTDWCQDNLRAYVFPNGCFCNALTSLQLTAVNVSGYVLENFIRNCPELEYIQVKWSKLTLKVRVASIKLKHLEIYQSSCLPVEHIEIFAPNLVTFKYYGPKISMPLKTTTKPVELLIGGSYAVHLLKNKFSDFRSYFSQLESLTLDIESDKFNRKYISEFPECKLLKQLEVIVDPGVDGDLFSLSTVIKACPYLHKFVLKLRGNSVPYLATERLKLEASPHDHLKILEIGGFIGHANDMEIIMYLVESCVALEKIVIDTRNLIFKFTLEEIVRTMEARKEAKKLIEKLQKLKPDADLIIL